MPLRAWTAVLKRAWSETTDDNIGLIAAGVAFYGFLALVPLLGATVLLYGIAVEPDTVLRDITRLTQVMPADAAKLVGEQLLEVVKASDGKKGLGLLLALAIALFGARNGAGAVITALNIAYEEPEKRGFIRLNILAIGITFAGVAIALVAALAITALGHLEAWLPTVPDPLVIAGKVVTYGAFTLAGAGVAATLYRYGPSREKARWVWLSPGSLLAALMSLALTMSFGLYVANFGNYNATYGSLGAVVATLTWLYLSSYILIFGAELNSELEHQATGPVGQDTPVGQESIASPEASMAVEEQLQPATPLDPPLPESPPSSLTLFAASHTGARIARGAGLPKIGWLMSAGAGLALALLRRNGRARQGAALLLLCGTLAYRSRTPPD